MRYVFARVAKMIQWLSLARRFAQLAGFTIWCNQLDVMIGTRNRKELHKCSLDGIVDYRREFPILQHIDIKGTELFNRPNNKADVMEPKIGASGKLHVYVFQLR